MAEYHSLQVTLFDSYKSSVNILNLPEGEPVGRYHFTGEDFLYIEAAESCWRLEGHSGVKLFNPADQQLVPFDGIFLTDQMFLMFQYQGMFYAVFSELYFPFNNIFHNYSLVDVDEIKIGRGNVNDIRYISSFVSGDHALMRRTATGWGIVDNNSQNGVFVNRKKVSYTELKCGDEIYIMGLRILMGTEYIGINTEGRNMELNSIKLKPVQPDLLPHSLPQSEEEELFNVRPRRRKPFPEDRIVIEAPPMPMHGDRMPLVLRMGGSMVMGTTSLLAGNVTSVLTSLMLPMMSTRFTEKQRKEYEERRQVVYRDYLERIWKQIEETLRIEQSAFEWNYPDLSHSLQIAENKERLWERKKTDDDFLTVRVGAGDRNMITPVDYPVDKLSIEPDLLEEEMRYQSNRPRLLKNVAVQFSLTEDFLCGVSGPKQIKAEFIRQLIMQLVIYHRYDEVKIVFLADEDVMKEFAYVRYLPHVWDDMRSLRFMASTEAEAGSIGEYLKGVFSEAEESDKKKPELKTWLRTHPYYVVIAFDKRLMESIELFKEVLHEEKSYGISLISVFDDLPRECTRLFSLQENCSGEVIPILYPDKPTENFHLDSYDPVMLYGSARMIANMKLKTLQQEYLLPKSLSFLGMFGVGRIEHLNIENRWKNSNPVQSLETPVGVGTNGELFMLDLHQKYHGPHGLVAGTTGSGKSEFLLTYILSLAVNYDPNEVAFVLIDYKGGGLAGAFDDPEHGIRLPHLVGTITNLDGSGIRRSLIAIQSELLRRQRVFNEVKHNTDEGTMDIYTYQRLFRNGKVEEPMPHLFIISDEFAELKDQQPEFMDKLISAARIGRSLGIHLILATQKPSGVVNDQIRSNTKFRVCLKVQDRSDSMDMLLRPDAAGIKETGRFYLQVGYNEYFAMGQSAWSGADYVPQDEVIAAVDDSLQLIDHTGHSLIETKKKVEKGAKTGSQLVATVKYISDIAGRRQLNPRQLWKPAISFQLSYKEAYPLLKEQDVSEGITAFMGIVDDPENQEQFPFVYDIQHGNHILILGESGSGKSTLLQTMLYDLTSRYTPEQVNYYIIDCSSHALRVFRDAPHCGAWFSEEDESDIARLLKFYKEEVARRKTLFEDEDVTGYDMYLTRHKLPLMLFVIDNIAAFNAINDRYYSDLHEYIKLAAGLGIFFIITASFQNELYSRTKQELGGRIALTLKEKYDYGELLVGKCEYVPDKKPGRGMINLDGRLLEFQAATIWDSESDDSVDNETLRKIVMDAVCESPDKITAKKLPVLQEGQEYIDFCSMFEKGRIPLGYSLKDIKPVALPLKQMDMLSVYMGCNIGRRSIFDNMIYAARMNDMRIIVLKSESGSCLEDLASAEDMEVRDLTAETLDDFILDMRQEMQPRIQVLQEYTRPRGLKASREDIYKDTYEYMHEAVKPVFIIIERFTDLYGAFTDTIREDALAKIMQISRNLGFYYMAGFYPGDKINTAYAIAKYYNREKTALYLGGRFNNDPFEYLSGEFLSIDSPSDYNRGIAYYHDKIYPVMMPCGTIIQERIPEDDKDIFA